MTGEAGGLRLDDGWIDGGSIDNGRDRGAAHTELPNELRSAADRSTDAVLVVGTDGTIRFANHAATAAFGVIADGAASVFVARDDSAALGRRPAAAHATTDRLTGLADRAALVDALARQDDAERARCAVLFCDLDGFKLVNDGHGHEAGDAVLVEVAERLRAGLRGNDTIARWGGDEFVVLLESLDRPSRAMEVAQRIVDSLALPIQIGDVLAQVGVSVGIASANGAPIEADDLLARADAAMYEAKRAGKGQVFEYTAALDLRLQERQALSRDLRAAFDSEQLQLWYRPVVDLETGDVSSVEASLRWRHPTRGTLTPDAFVTVADLSGMMTAIDMFVLSSAARDTCAWRSEHPDAHAWVTVSGRLLMQADGAHRMLTMLYDAQATAGSVGIEVSEDDVAHDYNALAPVLKVLVDGGVRIALDNFCGRLAVPQLLALRPHAVKLDRSFLDRLGSDTESARAVRSVVGMIRPLGISIVAKGVNSPAQLAAVVNLNCDAAQGAVVGDATPAADVQFHGLRLAADPQPYLPHERG